MLTQLPGGDLIEKGIADFSAHQITKESCLIAIARSRLLRAGLGFDLTFRIPDPEHQLYALLQAERGDAYSRYNSLLRRLISFSQALEQQ
jgi:hypothetical protein